MSGVVLDPHTGRPEGDLDVRPGVLMSFADPGREEDFEHQLHRAPEHIKKNLLKAADVAGPFAPRGSIQSWRETLYAPLADGATVTAAAEALMLPIFTLPANYLYPGRVLKWTLMGRQSTAITTPGTITFRLAYSATGLGAVVMATSGAFAPDPTAVATNLTFMIQWWTVVRSSGTAGTAMAWGKIDWSDYDDASLATLVANMGMDVAPTATPAVATIDTTVARALSPTYQPSLATASMTCHAGILEALT